MRCKNCGLVFDRRYLRRHRIHRCALIRGDDKQCFSCGIWKNLSLFPPHSNSSCRECINKKDFTIKNRQQREYKRKTDFSFHMKYQLISIKSRADKNGLPYNLNVEHMEELFKNQKKKCYYTGLPLELNQPKPWHRISVDRQTPSIGYVIGNVVLCVSAVNFFKNDLTEAEFALQIKDIQWPFLVNHCYNYDI